MNKFLILAAAGEELDSTPANGMPIDSPETNALTTEDGSPIIGDEVVESKQPQWMSFLPLAVLGVIFYFMLIKGPKKKQKKHTQMVQSIKKNDRIQTIGGILGTVLEIKDNEIVIKIDESNNTKMRITKGSVSTVLSDNS
jgi:preprotein translocase subunit YajC